MIGYLLRSATSTQLQKTLRLHFAGLQLTDIVTAARDFPITARVDVQVALDRLLGQREGCRLYGIHSQASHETPTLAMLLTPSHFPVELGPLQHSEVDVGDAEPARCLVNGLWLAQRDGLPYAVLLSTPTQFGHGGLHVEVGVPAGEAGVELSRGFFRDLEAGVAAGRTYRGRVLSLEAQHDYSGRGGAVKVHRLRTVAREEVILPQRTLTLLDRNVGGFVTARDGIKSLRFSAKKGLLFYGPPGTGKTHTIHYLAAQLPEHTTLLVTAEQVLFVEEYFRLARFLQPSIMVVEDVDLIARDRQQMYPGQEMLLNKLLNEMDGLREDAEVIFILTTNRPELLEPALAARPGRIDQAIEFPLPDDEGRTKLARLYAGGLELPLPVLELIVRRTKGVSAAFIKELMRRAAQFHLELDGAGPLQQRSVDGAIEEMVFAGGALNLKLLGGSGAPSFEASVYRQTGHS